MFKSISEICLIQLKKGASDHPRSGHPLIASNLINRIEGNPQGGDIVVVSDNHGKSIGWGPYNPDSNVAIRLLALETEDLDGFDLDHLLDVRIQEAAALRHSLGLPSQDTNAYRLLNSEGDRISGLIVDIYGDLTIVFSSAHWTEKHRAVIEEALQKNLGSETILWHPMPGELIQDGWTQTKNEQNGHLEGVLIQELGLTYKIALGTGQKTGYFCDHRENRSMIRRLARGRRVLDVFCYTGGFSLNAAIGGAQQVVGVDSSEQAVELAQENARMNNIGEVDFHRMEALSALGSAANYDLIILDPPKLAPSKAELDNAIIHYRHLNRDAIRVLPKNGLLFTASCSAALTMERFVEVIRDAARDADKRVSILKTSGAGPDHPIHPAFPEGNYLTCLLVGVL